MGESRDLAASREKSGARGLSRSTSVILGLLFLGAASAAVWWINASEPGAERTTATRKTAMLVEVRPVERGDFAPTITALGRVEAAQDIVLSPRVSGRVVALSEHFLPGGFVDEGEELVAIDPADYRIQVQQRQSALRQAQSDLALELGQREVARQEYELLDRRLSPDNQALVLREPQLDAARAGVAAAEAALKQAGLALERTRINAPFDAQVIRREVGIGSQVSPGRDLGRLIGGDEYWVIASVPVAKLERIAFPSDGGAGATVRVRDRTAWPEGSARVGRVRRLIGALDSQTRLARVLVSVSDPLARKPETRGPRMLVGAIVQVSITGRELEGVVRISRDHLRDDDTVWVMENGELRIRDARVAFKDADDAYLAEGLETGDLLVISKLATVADGAPLRTAEDSADAASEAVE